MKAVCAFYQEYLYKDATGRYVMDPSDAHETYEKVRNPVNDLAGIRYVFPALIQASEILQADAELRSDWREVLDNLAPYPMDSEKGILRPYELRPGESIMTEQGHVGHCPSEHAFAVFPLMTLGTDDCELARRSFLAHRAKFTNRYGWVVDSLAAARLGYSDDLKYLLTDHVRRFQHYRNGLMSYHPTPLRMPYVYFDGSGPVAIALNEMLLQGWNGVIRICPSLPADWDARFTLLAPGGVLVSGVAKQGTVQIVTVESEVASRVTIANPFSGPAIVRQNEREILQSDQELLQFEISPGTTYSICPADTPPPILDTVTAEPNMAPKPFPLGTEAMLGR